LGGVNAQDDPILDDMYTNMLPEVHDVQRRMRKLIDSYPGDRVLIGETYLPNTRELLKWYGGDKQDELQLPMDTLVGFHSEGGGPSSPNVGLSLPHFRSTLTDMETELGDNWPLLVFDNHDNPRSWDRFGDGTHNVAIAKLIATVLLTTRATALTYYGAEIGMVTSTPTRKQDVKDPIGITGWPKEKGRDGERTPMQWTPGPQAGFSTDPHTWLPVAADYKTVNVQTEEAEPDSELNWFRNLALLRQTNQALHSGKEVMINQDDPNVLSYVRTDGKTGVAVALNFTDQPHAITLDVTPAGLRGTDVKTMATDAPVLTDAHTLRITLPPYSTWIASVQ
jgi:alpha-glucosidase